MKLVNFRLQRPSLATQVIGLGFSWDLHKNAQFSRLTFHPERNEVILSWVVSSRIQNPWMDPGNVSKGCKLLFKEVDHLAIGAITVGQDHPERLESVSLADPKAPSYPYKDHWKDDEEFHLLFEFSDGRKIQVHSASVELQCG